MMFYDLFQPIYLDKNRQSLFNKAKVKKKQTYSRSLLTTQAALSCVFVRRIAQCDEHYIWLHSWRISLSKMVVRIASLPLISPSHPLLMFSTESEPCRMCTETSTRSTLLLPGRGSDYIWSINTHRHWEALCLSFFSLSSLLFHCLRLLLPLSCALTTVWHLVTICQAICLWFHISPTLFQAFHQWCFPTIHLCVYPSIWSMSHCDMC